MDKLAPSRKPVIAVLAGGRSRRMGGQEKALLKLHGIPLIERVLAAALPLRFQTYVICGDGPSEELQKAIDHAQSKWGKACDLEMTSDLESDRGPLGGLQSAFVASSAERILTLACDLPFLTTELLKFVTAESSDSNYDVVVPEDQIGLQPLCAVYFNTCRPLLEQELTGDRLSVVGFVEKLRMKRIKPDAFKHIGTNRQWFENINTIEDAYSAATTSQCEL